MNKNLKKYPMHTTFWKMSKKEESMIWTVHMGINIKIDKDNNIKIWICSNNFINIGKSSNKLKGEDKNRNFKIIKNYENKNIIKNFKK